MGLRFRRPLLHDGSAATHEEAVLRHGGEVASVADVTGRSLSMIGVGYWRFSIRYRYDSAGPAPSVGVDDVILSVVVSQKIGRFVSLCLLLLVGLDLAFPSLCDAESVLPSSSHRDEAVLGERGPEPTAPAQGPEEDCFCCCVHIRPQSITRGIESLEDVSGSLAPRRSLEPGLRVQSPFHPPKL